MGAATAISRHQMARLQPNRRDRQAHEQGDRQGGVGEDEARGNRRAVWKRMHGRQLLSRSGGVGDGTHGLRRAPPRAGYGAGRCPRPPSASPRAEDRAARPPALKLARRLPELDGGVVAMFVSVAPANRRRRRVHRRVVHPEEPRAHLRRRTWLDPDQPVELGRRVVPGDPCRTAPSRRSAGLGAIGTSPVRFAAVPGRSSSSCRSRSLPTPGSSPSSSRTCAFLAGDRAARPARDSVPRGGAARAGGRPPRRSIRSPPCSRWPTRRASSCSSWWPPSWPPSEPSSAGPVSSSPSTVLVPAAGCRR